MAEKQSHGPIIQTTRGWEPPSIGNTVGDVRVRGGENIAVRLGISRATQAHTSHAHERDGGRGGGGRGEGKLEDHSQGILQGARNVSTVWKMVIV